MLCQRNVKNAALLRLLGLPSMTLFKPEEFEEAGFVFKCGWKPFWKRNFSQTMTLRYLSDTAALVFFIQNSKRTGGCCVAGQISLPQCRQKTHLMRFQSETSVFNFFFLYMDGASSPVLLFITKVEPLLTDTSLIRTVHLIPGKCPYILCRKNNLYNTDPL